MTRTTLLPIQVIDGWAWAQAAVAAACNLNPYAASKQMRIAQALAGSASPHRGPVRARGAVSATVDRCDHLAHPPRRGQGRPGLIDAAIAGEAGVYGAHSEKDLINAVDLWVEKFDPEAVVRSKRNAKDLYVEFDDKDDPNGVSSFWGRLRVTDKKILEQRLDDLADTVCGNDPRKRGELHAAGALALGVVGPALERLTCECGDADCEGSGKDPRAGAVTIYVLTDQVPAASEDARGRPRRAVRQPDWAGRDRAAATGCGARGGRCCGDRTGGPSRPCEPASGRGRHRLPTPRPAACTPSPGVMLDGGIIPPAMLADLVATGATVKPLSEIADLPAERQYRPSTALTAFVRMRAMTCSFPGCNRPAHRCDLDHLIPWPAGATHPGNLAPLCRLHHLIKTFCGWTPHAQPDGSIQWSAPTGHTYTTAPGASMLFPHWNIQTPIPRKRAITLINDTDRDTKISPVRTRTRAQDRAQRIKAERARNQLQLALELADNDSDPPPFWTKGATRTARSNTASFLAASTGRLCARSQDLQIRR